MVTITMRDNPVGQKGYEPNSLGSNPRLKAGLFRKMEVVVLGLRDVQ